MKCRDCKSDASPGRVRCAGCLAKCRARHAARQQERITYTPLDEWASRPKTMVIRALRWLDWVEPRDLWAALGLGDERSGTDRYFQALHRLAKAGDVETRRTRSFRGVVTEYRLKPGIRAIAPHDVSACSDEEAAP